MNTSSNNITISNNDLADLLHNNCAVVVDGVEVSINYYEQDYQVYAVFNVNETVFSDLTIYGEEEEIILTDEQYNFIAEYLNIYYTEDFNKLNEFVESFKTSSFEVIEELKEVA